MVAPASAVARLPAGLPPVEAAPLMCAGLTTFNALRHSGAWPGDLVAVLGLGGLVHLAAQHAAKVGFRTVGIARGRDKEPLARRLGASVYLDSQAQDPAAELLKLGGAKVILATATSDGVRAGVLIHADPHSDPPALSMDRTSVNVTAFLPEWHVISPLLR
jgi:D-arabinose 1-dehydrogenase-like Zn-dependent alcohol dehydrogenase